MAVIITITSNKTIVSNQIYDYSGEDRMLQNIITGDYEIFYSGQNQGRFDDELIESVQSSSLFRIYYRKKNTEPFIFIGSTNKSSIIHERIVNKGVNSSPKERLQIRLVIPSNDVQHIKINTHYKGSGKYKKAVLEHSNFKTTKMNLTLGFFKEKII